MSPQPEDPRQLLQAILQGSPEGVRDRIRANLATFDQAYFARLTEVIRQARARGDARGAEQFESLPERISEARIGKDHDLEWQAASEALTRGQQRFHAGEWHEARRDAQEALTICGRIEHRHGACSALMLLARIAESSGDWRLAVTLFRQAAEQSRVNSFWRMEASAVLSAGELLRAAGDNTRARNLFERYLEIGVQLDLASLRAYGHLELAYADTVDDLDSAAQHLLAALSEGQAIADTYIIANAALNLGNIHLERKSPEAARPFLLQAKAAFEARDDTDGLAIANSFLERTGDAGATPAAAHFDPLEEEGRAALEAGDAERALEVWQRAAAIARKTGNHRGEAIVLTNTARLYRDRRNDPGTALGLFRDALSAARKAGHAQLQASIWNSIGRLHRSLGQRSEAKQAFESAAGAGELADDPATLGNILINLGNEFKLDRELWKAKPHYRRALALGEKANDDSLRVLALGNLGNVEEAWKNWSDAEQLYRQGLQIAEAAGYTQGIANQSNNLGSLFSKQRDWAASASFFERALEAADSMSDPELQIAGLRNVAFALENCGREQEALERLNRAALMPAGRVRPDIVDSIYESRAQLHVRLKETTAADADWQVLCGRVEARCDREFAVTRDIRVYQPLAQKAIERLSHTLAFPDAEKVAGQIEHVRAKPFCIASGTPALDAGGIARLLEGRSERTAFVHFAELREKIVVVGQQPGWQSPRLQMVDLSLQDVADCRTRQLQEVERHPEQPDLDETWLEMIAELAGAIADVAAGCEIAYLCPHSLLWYLPLHAASVGGEPLLERFPIVYVDSATRLAHLWQSPPKPFQSCFAAGVGLTANDDVLFQGEAKVVAQLFGAEALVGHRVTRQRILNGMPGKDLVHLSTHGRWKLESTALVLRDESELLFASDVERLNVPARLVYLSGCDSAWLDVTAILVGMRGFPAAFLEAGASSVIAASWPVSAPASLQIVYSFYQELRKPGATTAKALQQAQLGIRKKAYYGGRTYYWAPFSLVGDGR